MLGTRTHVQAPALTYAAVAANAKQAAVILTLTRISVEGGIEGSPGCRRPNGPSVELQWFDLPVKLTDLMMEALEVHGGQAFRSTYHQ